MKWLRALRVKSRTFSDGHAENTRSKKGCAKPRTFPIVMLNEVKHLASRKARPFTSFRVTVEALLMSHLGTGKECWRDRLREVYVACMAQPLLLN